ncbi:dienelactone hydrolase [Talaromyces stipitatus ATCC 10500]|uniref:Dienelactone hydrolase n=1 Tax=Talaromyces stipitatus (strain ATCC 10500 / CBS 375.48 / QM 6759 / NRRL 1006) TaxID=441959 RepID=B8MP32_TALSN|nr:dienelactone hydrolase [Talaromyces stipitatus ATCC 10500]EED14271.1 dienelactone hydrolase [Talaromyces stipitatus ATCC 10500]
MATISINTPGNGLVYNTFLNSQLSTPRLCITSEEEEFDTETIRNWQNEGFDVTYVPLNEGGKDYASRLESVKEGLRVGESYAIIAYGEAAAFCLDHFHKPATGARLTALVAYYPTAIPDTRIRFPPSLKVLVHLAGESVDVVVTPQALGIQGRKKRISKRRIDPGVGIGERKDISYTAFTYDFADPGFAEHDLDEYDHASAELAWSRTLDVMRKAFRKDADLERPWEINTESSFFRDNLSDTMSTFVTHKNPAVTVGPTLAGGVGAKALRRFYENDFLQTKPPSMRLRLLSRTVGADRVVDEIYITFDHTVEMPWMLPGVPPTGKRVEIILVAVIALKAERIFTEHLYWDQASVLVQLGLLDTKLLPQGVSGVKQLPVVGREAARRILGEHPARGDDYHRRLIANARAPPVTNNSRASRQSTPKPAHRAGGKEVEQRNGEQNRANGASSSKLKGDIADAHASGNESTATATSTPRKPKKLGTPRKDKDKSPIVDDKSNDQKDEKTADKMNDNGKTDDEKTSDNAINGKNEQKEKQVESIENGKDVDDFADGESEAGATPSRPMAARVESAGQE